MKLRLLAAVALAACSCQATAYRGRDQAGRELVVLSRCGEEFVRVDGEEHASFRSIDRSTLTSSEGQLIYVAADEDGSFIVREGRVVAGPFAAIARLERLSSSAFAAVEVAEGRARVHIVGPGETLHHAWYDAILEDSLLATPTGGSAYVAQLGGKDCVVVDGRLDRCFDGVSALTVTRSQIAYLGRQGSRSYVVRGATLFGPYEDVAGLYASPHSERAVALLRTDDAWFVDDGVERSEPYERLGEVHLTSARRTVFWARNGEQEFVVIDGIAFGPYEQVKDRAITIGADGVSVAYVVRANGRDVLHVDGTPYGPAAPFQRIAEVGIGSDGRIAFIAQEGEGRAVVIDGTLLGTWSKAAALKLVGPGKDLFIVRERGRDWLMQGPYRRDLGVALSDTLVLGSNGQSWAIAAIGDNGLVWHHSGGGEPQAVDLEEVVGELLRRGVQPEPTALRDWLRRELEVAERAAVIAE